VFLAAREREAADRFAFLEDACAGDAELRAEVDSLLAADTWGDEDDEPAIDWLAGWERSSPPLVGRQIGPYRLLEELGSGGMGTVYLAERADMQFRQRVALKILRAEAGDDEHQRRFRMERQVLARLQHPKIARLYDGGVTDDGRPWFAMEYVAGRALDLHCIEESPTIGRRIELLLQACDAVQYAHRNMIVHRDLKPSNILVTGEGDVRLLDFGIAKLLDPTETAGFTRTRTDARPMTPGYASPEQIRGQAVSAASDVYSLGVVLYQILTSRRPYLVDGLVPSELERVVCIDEPPAPSAVVADADQRRSLAGDLDTIVRKALAKEPERRYPSVEALADDLRRFLDGRPVLARPDTASYRLRKFVRRHRWGVTAAAAVALSLVAGIVGTAWQANHARDQARVAAQERDRAQQVSAMLVGMFAGADPINAGAETVSARALLDRGRARLETDLADDPALRATLALTMGAAYRNLGLFAEAESLFVMSLRERRALAEGRSDVAVAEALTQVGNVLLDRGREAEARDRFQEALAIFDAHAGATVEELANAHQGLGAALHHLAETDGAIAHHRIALRILREGGAPPLELALALSNLGAALHHAGDLAAADSALREAVEIHRRDSPESASLAMAINNLASLRSKQKEHSAAESLLRESLAIRLRVFGEDHPLVAASRNNLAAVLKRQGKLAEAEVLHRTALAGRRAAFGNAHPAVAQSLHNLAMLVRERGDLEEAERLFRESLEVRRRAYKGPHPELASGIHALGRILHERGRSTEAEPLLREALAMRRSLGGAEPDEVLETARELAALLEETGRAAEASTVLAGATSPLLDGSPNSLSPRPAPTSRS
jgi:serine/threonine-protein kinase